MAYERYCASCTYLNDNCYCENRGEDHRGSDPKCRYYCEAYSRSNSARENLYESEPTSSGCYLTTIMCKILNFEDNNYYLNTLRKFRDKTMQKNPKYIPLLLTYDTIGPMIAYKLETDPNRHDIATAFFDNYIVKAVDAIEVGKEETAINIYKAMTYSLTDKYNINTNYNNDVDITEINPKTLGHGYTKKLVK